MNHLKNYKKKFIFLLGFFSALPFFFIPYKPFIFINRYHIDNLWNYKPILYPGYTASLGLASPFVLTFLVIFFCFVVFSLKKEKKKFILTILSGLLVILNTLVLFFLSSSIKSFGASVSLWGLLIIIILMNNLDFKIYYRGFLISLIFFVNLHAISLLLSGIEVSHSINGISIFGVEIYQSLVSYVYVVSFFFGTLILKKKLLINLINFENEKINLILYYITLISCFIIIIIMQRRFAFLIILFSLIIFFIIYLKKNKIKLLKQIFFTTIFFLFVYIFINKFFVGKRAINYIDMIQPRLSGIINSISEIFYSSSYDFYFGKFKDWGNIESGFINLLLNTGVVGLLSYLITFAILIYMMYQKLNILTLKKSIFYIFFSFFVLFFSNIINNSISTPYFFISFFIIFVSVLIKKNIHD